MYIYYSIAPRIPPGQLVWGWLRRLRWLRWAFRSLFQANLYDLYAFFGPKLVQMALKWAPGGSKSALERTKSIFGVTFVSKSALGQCQSPIFIDFCLIWGSLLEAILVNKSLKFRVFFQCCFFRAFGTTFEWFWVVFLSFWEVKNHFEVVLDAIFWKAKKHQKVP